MPDLTAKIRELQGEQKKTKSFPQVIEVPIEQAKKLQKKLQKEKDWGEILWHVFLGIYSLVGVFMIVTMLRLNLGL